MTRRGRTITVMSIMTLSAADIKTIETVVDILNGCENILFITGAGISADSGLPTYRGIGGLYNESPTQDGVPIEVALSGQMLQVHPELTWKYLSRVEQKYRAATFNRAHEVIALMERCFDRVRVLTQNIDGLHHAAGSKHVIDIHGYIYQILCMRCDFKKRVRDYSQFEIPPLCPMCGEIMRPDVVFFGEMLPEEKCMLLFAELDRGFDIVFSVGTTSVFPYITEPVLRAKRMRVPTVEINPGESEVTHIVDYRIAGGAAEAMDALWKRYQEKHAGNSAS